MLFIHAPWRQIGRGPGEKEKGRARSAVGVWDLGVGSHQGAHIGPSAPSGRGARWQYCQSSHQESYGGSQVAVAL